MAKKKSQANKPVRGFATTSIVKKKDPEPEPEPEPEQAEPTEAAGASKPSESNAATSVGKAAQISSGQTNGPSTSLSGNDWDASEEKKALEAEQVLAERVRMQSEKEASKQMKILEYEKRVSSSLPDFSWDDPNNVKDRVLASALSESKDLPLMRYTEPDEKLLSRIGGLFLILQKLGFDREQVEECLLKVCTLELDDAIAWLYLRYSPSIRTEKVETGPKPYGLGNWSDQALSMPATPSSKEVESFPALPPPGPKPAAVAAPKAPVQTPTAVPRAAHGGSSLLAYRNPDSDSDDSDGDESRQEGTSAVASATTSDLDEAEDDPDSAYVATKVQITSLQRKLGLAGKGGGKKGSKAKAKPQTAIKGKTADDEKLEVLEGQLKKIQQMYLFNQKHAEAAYLTERARVDKLELAERLAGKAKEREATPDQSTAASTTEAKVSTVPDVIGTAAEGDNLFGDMLETHAETSQQEDNDEPERTASGSVIVVRDMALPKAYTGKTPRSLLDDAIRRLDKYGKTTYRVISRSRAVRAVVSIRWDSGKMEQYGMEEEACDSQDQAFQYAATLALFAIAQDGSLHRLLPPKFRDLWDELEERKKVSQAAAYEEQMHIYRRLAEGRRAVAAKEPAKATAISNLVLDSSAAAMPANHNTGSRVESGESLQAQLAQRQQTYAYQSMLPTRQGLPIAAYRDHIVSTVEQNQVVVLCGETGCGKSTQTPTMILEDELAHGRPVKIYCTEPRRISAISLAQRVSQELGEPNGALGGKNSYIGYNIRLETRVSAATRLTYATTGILLRMLEGDTELQDVTHVIIDEVHERSIDSDFLLIILRTLLKRRSDLRILLMSATVDADKIATYMGGCPVINVPGRTFPVTPYFLEDAVELSHYRLDFDSDSPFVQRLQRKGGRRPAFEDLADLEDLDDSAEQSKFGTGYSKQTLSTLQAMNESMINFDLLMQLLETVCFVDPQLQQFSTAILVFLPSLDTIRKVVDLLESHPKFGTADFRIFPLHSSISNEQQAHVFEVPPRGVRKIVVSTNIAETGVTIPDVTAVIDSGRHKEMRFDEKRQISRLVECWIARSNGLQRRGRAGRVQEGICFHLFSKARFETGLAEHPIPEMLRLSLQDLALRIKILKFSGSVEDTLGQALDPPLAINVQRAVASLIEVKALTINEEITQLGKHLVKLPLDVHTAKLCLFATIFGCLDAALTIAATLNSKSFFLTPFGREAEADTIKRSFKVADEHSDFLVMHRAYKLWRQHCYLGSWSTFCRKHFLSHPNLMQIEELKIQYLGNLVEAGFIPESNGHMRYPKGPRLRFAKIDATLDRASDDGSMVMAVIAAAMHPKLLHKDAGAVWKTLSNNAPAAIHPSSSNFIHGRRPDFGDAPFIAYFNIQQSKRLYVWENGAVAEKAIMLLCGEAEVKHAANSMSIDRKIRRHVERKSGLAIQLLRSNFDEVLQARLNAPAQPLSEKHQEWFGLLEQALASEAEQDRLKASGHRNQPAVAISVVRAPTEVRQGVSR